MPWRVVLLVGLNLAAALGLIGIWIDGHPADCQSEGCSREIRDARAKAKLFWSASTARARDHAGVDPAGSPVSRQPVRAFSVDIDLTS
jgi:hypothetical protein